MRQEGGPGFLLGCPMADDEKRYSELSNLREILGGDDGESLEAVAQETVDAWREGCPLAEIRVEE